MKKALIALVLIVVAMLAWEYRDALVTPEASKPVREAAPAGPPARLSAGPQPGEVWRCKDKTGRYVFTDQPYNFRDCDAKRLQKVAP